MNPTKRSVLGVVSSLLLTAGLVRAAEQFDPVAKVAILIPTDGAGARTPAEGCVLPSQCYLKAARATKS